MRRRSKLPEAKTPSFNPLGDADDDDDDDYDDDDDNSASITSTTTTITIGDESEDVDGKWVLLIITLTGRRVCMCPLW